MTHHHQSRSKLINDHTTALDALRFLFEASDVFGWFRACRKRRRVSRGAAGTRQELDLGMGMCECRWCGKRASPQRGPHRRTLCLHLQVCVCNHHHHHHVQFQLYLLSLGHIKHAHAPQRNTGARAKVDSARFSLLQMRMRFHCIDLRILSIPQSHTCAHNVTTLATVTDGPSLFVGKRCCLSTSR